METASTCGAGRRVCRAERAHVVRIVTASELGDRDRLASAVAVGEAVALLELGRAERVRGRSAGALGRGAAVQAARHSPLVETEDAAHYPVEL